MSHISVFLPEMQARRARGVVYGPVRSRRLGYSLGLNVLPQGSKLCPFDCVYCEVGAEAPAVSSPADGPFPAPETVLATLDEALPQTPGLDSITFSGSGEPTLHPQFDVLVEGVARLRDRHCPATKVIVLSNGALANQAHVRAGLERADVRIMKLDAGDAEIFRAVNRPAPSVTLDRIIANLAQIDDVTLQTILLDGPVSNAQPEAYAAYLDAVRAIRPSSIQLYSLSRAAPLAGIREVPCEVLRMTGRDIEQRTGVPVKVYCNRA